MLSARQPGQPVYSGLRPNDPDSGPIAGELDWTAETSAALVRYQVPPENSNLPIIVMGDREHFISTHVLRGRSGIWAPSIRYGETVVSLTTKARPSSHGRLT